MTTAIRSQQQTIALRRAAVRATLAPSVHNTQPWRFELAGNELAIFADPTRQLHVLDPTKRQLTISCGCALFNARASLASQGYLTHIDRLPDYTNPNLLATIRIVGSSGGVVDPLLALDGVVELRQTNRRRFSADAVPAEVVNRLQEAAEAEDSLLAAVRSDESRTTVASLSQKADTIQNLNPAYRAELRAWTSNDQHRLDGIPTRAIPHVDGTSTDEIPIRDFDSQGEGWLTAQTHSSRNQCLLLLGTQGDGPAQWLRAGEALERILLEVTRQGFAASPLTQIVEVATTREALRTELGLTMHPHILLRVGRAPLTPSSPRRRLVDVLVERS